MNIFEMARQNSDNLKGNYSLLVDRCQERNEQDNVEKFARLIENEWTISINMRLFVLNNFLLTNKYMNIYELKKEIKKHLKYIKSDVSVEEAIKKHLKGYYRPRTLFDRSFEDGEKFKYSALTIGGLGLREYGEYCIVIKPNQSRGYVSLAFIKEASLNYVDEDQIDINRLSRDVADRECVHILAALKHEGDVKTISPDEWTSSICCDECYIEAVTTDDILNSHIECVRMSEEDYYFHYVLLHKDYLSELDEFEKYELYDFKNMQELLKEQGIRLEVLGK